MKFIDRIALGLVVVLSTVVLPSLSYQPQGIPIKDRIVPRDDHQRRLEQLLKNDSIKVLLVTGAAGTGKTLLSCQEALSQFQQKKRFKIVITRPLVFVENEELGFLPGNMNDKMTPWTMPILDHMKEFLETSELKRLINENKIEISPLGYMRGRTFKNSFIILDEAQNTTPQQMKMFLTRIGSHSKIVVNGDLDQSDLTRGTMNGLEDFILRLKSHYEGNPHAMYEDGFGVLHLQRENTYRHPIIENILKIYDGES
jgi:phosphate starvation-inducible PhoH-like protein